MSAPIEKVAQVFREFRWWNYGINDAAPCSPTAFWVPDLARTVVDALGAHVGAILRDEWKSAADDYDQACLAGNAYNAARAGGRLNGIEEVMTALGFEIPGSLREDGESQ